MTLFEKIAAGEIPAKIIQQDEDLIVFHDINPQAPIHVLVVPKKPIPRLTGATKEDGKLLGDLLLKAQEIAKSLGIAESGFRVVINNGRNGGETVPHLHVHLLGGRPLAPFVASANPQKSRPKVAGSKPTNSLRVQNACLQKAVEFSRNRRSSAVTVSVSLTRRGG